jgi:hypothetical protein
VQWLTHEVLYRLNTPIQIWHSILSIRHSMVLPYAIDIINYIDSDAPGTFNAFDAAKNTQTGGPQ